jgi:hypothetical protein
MRPKRVSRLFDASTAQASDRPAIAGARIPGDDIGAAINNRLVRVAVR